MARTRRSLGAFVSKRPRGPREPWQERVRFEQTVRFLRDVGQKA